MSVLVVTGTATGVGKTVVAAAVAALAAARGASVAVVKPAETGRGPGEPGDLEVVRRLAALPGDVLHEHARFRAPLSPAAAARVEGVPPVSLRASAARVRELGAGHRLVLVEGVGGLLARFDDDGATLADLARAAGAAVLVVAGPGQGGADAAALTLEALAHRGIALAGVVVGAWPTEPDLAARAALRDLETLAARPLAGVMPAGSARLTPPEFLTAAHAGLGPALGGRFDAPGFRRRFDPAPGEGPGP